MPKDRKRRLLVDGYNVVRSASRYSQVSAPNPDYDFDWFNTVREMLLNDVASFAGRTWQATVVFDGGGNPYSEGAPTRVGNVEVVFSPTGSSADKVIEKLAFEARNAGFEVMVVTSDASIQDAVFGGGVDRMSAEGFAAELAAHCDNWREEAVAREGGVEGAGVGRGSGGRGSGGAGGSGGRCGASNSVTIGGIGSKRTLAERISPEALEKLKALRDGN